MKLGNFGLLNDISLVNTISTIWNIVRVLDMLGIPEAKKDFLEVFNNYGLTYKELNDQLILKSFITQHLLIPSAKERLKKDLATILKNMEKSMVKFFGLFGVKKLEIIEFLSSREKMEKGLIYFAKEHTVDPYFYEHILPVILSEDMIQNYFSKNRNKILQSKKVQDVKSVYKDLLRKGIFVEKDGEIWVME